MKRPEFKNPLTIFSPAFAGGPAPTNGMMFSSSSGGNSGGNDDDFYDDEFEETEYSVPEDDAGDEQSEETTARRPQSNRTIRRNAAPAAEGRPRSSTYQPEERYWADYLRVALPVLGLILVVGLLWLWATRLLGEDTPPTDVNSTEVVGLVATNTPGDSPAQTSPTGTPEGTQTASNNLINLGTSSDTNNAGDANQGTETTTTQQSTNGDQAAGTAEATSAPTGDLAAGTNIRITDDVNMRDDASPDATLISVVPAGTEAQIVGGPYEEGGYTWYQIVLADGQGGYIINTVIEVVP